MEPGGGRWRQLGLALSNSSFILAYEVNSFFSVDSTISVLHK